MIASRAEQFRDGLLFRILVLTQLLNAVLVLDQDLA